MRHFHVQFEEFHLSWYPTPPGRRLLPRPYCEQVCLEQHVLHVKYIDDVGCHLKVLSGTKQTVISNMLLYNILVHRYFSMFRHELKYFTPQIMSTYKMCEKAIYNKHIFFF